MKKNYWQKSNEKTDKLQNSDNRFFPDILLSQFRRIWNQHTILDTPY